MLAPVFQAFIDRLERARDEEDLSGAMSVITSALGLSGFAYVGVGTQSSELPRYVTTYPAAWVRQYVRRRYDQIDPVLAHMRKTLMPFLWGDQTGGPCTSRDQPQLFDEARQFGIICGFSVPIHDSRGGVTSLTFVSNRKAELEQTVRAHQHTLHLAAMYFDAHAHRKLTATVDDDCHHLSRRELICLRWIACGKSTAEIGKILGISRSGVAWHLRAAQRKLGAATLSQAIAVALQRKLIRF